MLGYLNVTECSLLILQTYDEAELFSKKAFHFRKSRNDEFKRIMVYPDKYQKMQTLCADYLKNGILKNSELENIEEQLLC